jgi:hypothetical protein
VIKVSRSVDLSRQAESDRMSEAVSWGDCYTTRAAQARVPWPEHGWDAGSRRRSDHLERDAVGYLGVAGLELPRWSGGAASERP